MGGKFSKNKVVESLSMEGRNPEYQSDLTSFEAACRADPSLQDFDKTLHYRAYRVNRTLSGDAENQSLTFTSVGELTLGLLEIDLALPKVILASKEETCKDNELSRFVEDYFDHGLKILEFYIFLERCLRRARDSQLRIQLALMHLEEERGENVGRERHVKTLQELQKFKEASDPFTDEFSKLFHSMHNQQAETWQKLHARKKKLD
ncbi:hypothetical protein NL676_023058 [Syzygium grande]|nr:hypothetical protein NL676_023058 [Syzygium grande]